MSEFKNNRRLRPTRFIPPISGSRSRHAEIPAQGEPFSPASETPSVRRIYDVHEIAKIFHKCPETVKRLFRDGKLHGFKFANSWFMFEADLHRDIRDALESGRHLRREEER